MSCAIIEVKKKINVFNVLKWLSRLFGSLPGKGILNPYLLYFLKKSLLLKTGPEIVSELGTVTVNGFALDGPNWNKNGFVLVSWDVILKILENYWMTQLSLKGIKTNLQQRLELSKQQLKIITEAFLKE